MVLKPPPLSGEYLTAFIPWHKYMKVLGINIYSDNIFFYPSLEKYKEILINDSLCMALCWRLFHKHSAMKTIRMRTITPSTQPTMRYNISLLLAGLVAGPTFPPFPEELGGVLKSFRGYSEAPGTRLTG